MKPVTVTLTVWLEGDQVMAVDVEQTIPPEWLHAEAKPQVIGFIRHLHVLPSVKRSILARWALIVGASVDPDEYAYVQVTTR